MLTLEAYLEELRNRGQSIYDAPQPQGKSVTKALQERKIDVDMALYLVAHLLRDLDTERRVEK